MNGSNGQMSFMDVISLVSFIIGLANYNENVDQGQLQETVSKAVKDIHNHLQIQDQKIEEILSLLKGSD